MNDINTGIDRDLSCKNYIYDGYKQVRLFFMLCTLNLLSELQNYCFKILVWICWVSWLLGTFIFQKPETVVGWWLASTIIMPPLREGFVVVCNWSVWVSSERKIVPEKISSPGSGGNNDHVPEQNKRGKKKVKKWKEKKGGE